MNDQKQKHSKAFIIIIFFLASILFLRGMLAVITEEYVGTAKYSGAYTLVGAEAIWVGLANIMIAFAIACTIPIYIKFKEKQFVYLMIAMFIATILCYSFSYFKH